MASGRMIDYLGSGIIADRPASLTLFAGTVGLWYATDTDVLSAWDGSTWEDIVGAGGTGTVTSVDVAGGTGLDSSGGPITTTGTITLDLDSASIASLALADSSVQSVTAGTNVTVDNTDPQNPIVSATAGGTGDVVGPATAVDSNVVLFDTTSGKLIKDGGTLGTAAFTASTAYATAAQGATADSAVQPGDNVSDLVNDADYFVALADPGADRIQFWDDSAGAVDWLTLGTNLSITGTTLDASGGGGVAWGAITGTLSDQTDLQTALDAKADESITLTAGTGLDGGGDLSTNRTFDLDAATIASLALADSSVQPADSVTTLDMATARLLGRSTGGAGSVEEITLGTNLSFTGTTLNAAGGGGSPGGSDKQVQYNDAGAFGAEAGFEYDDSTNILTVPNITLSGVLNEVKATNIASATTTDIGAATGNYVHITGTTTITGFGTAPAGVERVLLFEDVLTLTNASAIALPGGSNITTAVGDIAIMRSEGSGDWVCEAYTRKDGTAVIAPYQPLDSDLTTIAGLSASNDDFMQRKAGAWAARSILQVAVDMNGDGLTAGSVSARIIPQNSKSAAYTLVAADSGKHIYHPGADTTARIWTIPANASVAWPVGTALTFVNDTSAGVITIAITSDTLVLAGAGTTGSRTLAANGIATAIKMTSTRWMISGTGLT